MEEEPKPAGFIDARTKPEHPKMSNVWRLFHAAWGQAKDRPMYDKEMWQQIQVELWEIEKAFRAAEEKNDG